MKIVDQAQLDSCNIYVSIYVHPQYLVQKILKNPY